MGRKAGVTVAETRDALLRAAAVVFARDGYEGASIADIAAEAGISSGPIYTHFGGKAELFAATLRAYDERTLDEVLGRVEAHDAATILAAFGRALTASDKPRPEAGLLIEAIVAARRDPAAAELVAERLAARERAVRRLVSAGQRSGDLDERVSPSAVARFSLVVGLGSLLVDVAGLDRTDQEEWSRLIAGITRSMRAR